MIRLVEALNYRSLRYVRQDLGPFHVLVGPNGSGKSTFLDVIAFIGTLVSRDLEDAVSERTQIFSDLLYANKGDRFELAVEAELPAAIQAKLGKTSQGFRYHTIRYEVAIGLRRKDEPCVKEERVNLLSRSSPPPESPLLFPVMRDAPSSIITPPRAGRKRVITKVDNKDSYMPEITDGSGKKWTSVFDLGPKRSALGHLPDDHGKFPASLWFRDLLTEGLSKLQLDSKALRDPSRPGLGQRYQVDGSNLPWVVKKLGQESPQRRRAWIEHLRTAIPSIQAISTWSREEDKHEVLRVKYANGVEVNSWMVSDGTLRLLALTLLAYQKDSRGVFLIEEPENGIHPQALETVHQSLSSTWNSQVLLATHSPLLLGMCNPSDLLCFAATDTHGTDIVRGDRHPNVRAWQKEFRIADYFAAGVLS